MTHHYWALIIRTGDKAKHDFPPRYKTMDDRLAAVNGWNEKHAGLAQYWLAD